MNQSLGDPVGEFVSPTFVGENEGNNEGDKEGESITWRSCWRVRLTDIRHSHSLERIKATMKEIRKVNESLGDPVGEFVSPTFDIHIRWRE